LFGWFVGQVREVNRANAVMRVPELRARHTGPWALAGGVSRCHVAGKGRCARVSSGRRDVSPCRGNAR